MGFRSAMKVLDPSPAGGDSTVLSTSRRTIELAKLGNAAPLLSRRGQTDPLGPRQMSNNDMWASSYSASFVAPAGKKNLRQMSSSALPTAAASVLQGSGSPGSLAKSSSLPAIPGAQPPLASIAETQASMVQSSASKGPTASQIARAGASAAQQRSLREVLGNPDLERMAKQIFKQHDPNKDGKLDHQELAKVLVKLHEAFGLDTLDANLASELFKKYDINGDQLLTWDEFYDLLLTMMRQAAFSHGDVIDREFFINKQEGKVWDTFKKNKKLGEGSFGAAYLVKNLATGEDRVVKAVKKSRVRMPVEDVEREIMVMRQVDHPHVVRLFRWYEDAKTIYLVLEALKGGTLKEALQKFQKNRTGVKEDWIREVTRQCIMGLAYVHSLRLIHKDIKDENIMMIKNEDPEDTKPFAVIIDLGVAEMFTSADPTGKECGGTPVTMSPEVWLGGFGPKCDVWSLGCVLYEMLAGGFPFMATSMNPQAWLRLHRRGPDWTAIKTSPGSKAMCQTMLTFEENKRPWMRDCLKHDWFKTEKHKLGTVKAAQYQELMNFCKQTTFKRTLLLEIASKLPIERAKDIVALFEDVDANHDGRLQQDELVEFFKRCGLSDDSLAVKVFETLDVDSNGELSFSEFAAGCLTVFKDILEDRLEAFMSEHDKDKDGRMAVSEAQHMLGGVAQAMGGRSSSKDQAMSQTLDALMGNQASMSRNEFRSRLMAGPALSPKVDLSVTGQSGMLSNRSGRSGSGLRTPLPGGGRMLSGR
eukprot:TRINITY_DN80079_c0_g1_i1.p1 TRINITY_DN80079_c0_g1~~TRINITY_DN80079_c0_g1_i1.p1  ORF type:complete len:758 (-),score=194.28 TRINITY_DN80079_c0_g1_i1:207-2480(-)